MAVAFRSRTRNSSASSSSITVAKPTGLADGDLVVVQITINNSASVSSAPSGFTQLFADAPNSSVEGEVWTKLITDAAGEGTWTFSLTGSQTNEYVCSAWTGADGTFSTVTSQLHSSFSSSSTTIPSVTVASDGSAVLAGISIDSSSRTTTAPAGYTEISDTAADYGTGRQGCAGYYLLRDTGSTGTISIGISSATNYVAYGFAINPATGGGPQTIDAGISTETDTALTSVFEAGTLIVAADIASETDLALPASFSSTEVTVDAGLASETDVALPASFIPGSIIVGAGIASETDTALTASYADVLPTVVSSRYGGVTETAVVLNIELTGTTPVIKISSNSDLSSPVTTVLGVQQGSTDFWKFSVTGLTAGTSYYAGFGTTAVAEFTTVSGSAESYSALLGSCYNSGSTDTFTMMLNRKTSSGLLTQVMLIGDVPYIDNTSNAETNYLDDWSTFYARSAVNTLLAESETHHSWSDHDYGDNNSDGSETYKSFAQSAWRKVHPSYTIPANDIYQTWVRGRVRWISLDVMSNRDPESTGTAATRTMLGSTQLAWLLDLIANSTEPAIVINVSEAWIIDGESNGWDIYAGERETIADAIQAAGANRFVLVHGDAHMLAWDDGTNSNYAATPVGNGPPVFCFAPIQNTNSVKGGPYSEGTWSSNGTQYGEIEVEDSGGSSLTLWVRGLSVTSSSTETERFEAELTFTGEAVIGAMEASETDTALPASFVPGSITIDAGLASETDASLASDFASGSLTVGAGISSESDSALPASFIPGSITVAAGLAVSVDSSLVASFAAGTGVVAAGLAEEATEALTAAFVPGSITTNANIASETSAALSASFTAGSVTIGAGIASSTETALPVAFITAGIVIAVAAEETDTALPAAFIPGSITVDADIAEETDAGLTAVFTSVLTVNASIATETDTALPALFIAGSVTITASAAEETDSGLPLLFNTGALAVDAGISTETDEALPATFSSILSIASGLASEVNTALPAEFIAGIVTIGAGIASEINAALPILSGDPYVIPFSITIVDGRVSIGIKDQTTSVTIGTKVSISAPTNRVSITHNKNRVQVIK